VVAAKLVGAAVAALWLFRGETLTATVAAMVASPRWRPMLTAGERPTEASLAWVGVVVMGVIHGDCTPGKAVACGWMKPVGVTLCCR